MSSTNDDVLALLAEHGDRLYVILFRLTIDHDVADDLMQELFLNLTQCDGFVSADNPLGHVVRSVTHSAFDWRRKQIRMPSVGPLPDNLSSDGEGNLLGRDTWSRVSLSF